MHTHKTHAHMRRTDEVGDVVAVAEPSGGLMAAGKVDAVEGLVGSRDVLPCHTTGNAQYADGRKPSAYARLPSAYTYADGPIRRRRTPSYADGIAVGV